MATSLRVLIRRPAGLGRSDVTDIHGGAVHEERKGEEMRQTNIFEFATQKDRLMVGTPYDLTDKVEVIT